MAGTVPQVGLDDQGREVLDHTPIVINLGSGRRITDVDRIRELIQVQMSAQAAAAGMETLEEANDFDVDDELFPVSAHEYSEQTELADMEALAAEAERRKKALSFSRPVMEQAGKPVRASSESAVQGDSAPPEET